jgi:hypothetical protein
MLLLPATLALAAVLMASSLKWTINRSLRLISCKSPSF